MSHLFHSTNHEIHQTSATLADHSKLHSSLDLPREGGKVVREGLAGQLEQYGEEDGESARVELRTLTRLLLLQILN